MDMVGQSAQRTVLGIPAEVHQFCDGFTDAFEQTVDGIGLNAVKRKFTDNLLLIIGKHGCNVTHDFSIKV
jgi:hypothetical protein